MFAPGGDDPRTPTGNTKKGSTIPGAPIKKNPRKTQGLKNDASLEEALDTISEIPSGFGDIKGAFEGQSRGLYSVNPGNFNPSGMGFGLSPESRSVRHVRSAPDLTSINIDEGYTTPPQSPSGSPKGAPDGPHKKGLANPRTKGGGYMYPALKNYIKRSKKKSKKSKKSKKNSKKNSKKKSIKARRRNKKSKKSKKHH